MIIFLIADHPGGPGLIVIKVDGREGNALMGRYGPALLSRQHGGYVLDAARLGQFTQFAEREGARVVDERSGLGKQRADTAGAQPLPECANCGQPRRGHLGTCRVIGCVDPGHVLAPPPTCSDCGHPWVDRRFGIDPPTSPPKPWIAVRPELGEIADAAKARQLATLTRGLERTRQALGIRPRKSADEAALAILCPWCAARPGQPCSVLATGRILRITAGHPARYAAAGVEPPDIDSEALRAPLSDELAGEVPQ